MQILKLSITTIFLATTSSANAWWAPFDNHRYDGYDNGNGSTINSFMNDMTGDIDFTFDVKIKMRGFGNMFNNWSNSNNVSSYDGYAPYSNTPYRYGSTPLQPVNAE